MTTMIIIVKLTICSNCNKYQNEFNKNLIQTNEHETHKIQFKTEILSKCHIEHCCQFTYTLVEFHNNVEILHVSSLLHLFFFVDDGHWCVAFHFG